MLPDKYRARHNTIAATAGSDALPDDWEFVHPIRPSAYDAGILATHNDNTRRRKESIHTDLINQYEAFTLYEDLYKYKLEEAFDEAYFSTLKDELFGDAGQTVASMLHHLNKQCLALTGREKKEKMDTINLEWNQDDDIETYFVKADKLEEELLLDYGITWPTSMKITQVIDQMYASNVFSEDDMMDWEDKDDDEKTWIHLQSYFKRKWTKKRRYRGDTPKDHGFAANVEERENDAMDRLGTNLHEVATAATADKEHIQQMSTQNEKLLQVVKKNVTSVVFCTGKFYYDLLERRTQDKREDVAIVRIEQLFPLPTEQLEAIIATYTNAKEYVWAQEEPKNMGAWGFMLMNFESVPLRLASRRVYSSPAAGSSTRSKARHKEVIDSVFQTPKK